MIRKFIDTRVGKLPGTLPLSVSLVIVTGCAQPSERPSVSAGSQVVEGEPRAAVRHQIDSLLEPYLSIRQRLAEDRFEGIGAKFAQVREAAKTLMDTGDPQVRSRAKQVVDRSTVNPKTISEARAAFKDLSAAVISLAGAAPPSADVAPVLYEVRCPMAKASWFQGSKEVANPYMGQRMLKCGSIQQTIEAVPADKKGQS